MAMPCLVKKITNTLCLFSHIFFGSSRPFSFSIRSSYASFLTTCSLSLKIELAGMTPRTQDTG